MRMEMELERTPLVAGENESHVQTAHLPQRRALLQKLHSQLPAQTLLLPDRLQDLLK